MKKTLKMIISALICIVMCMSLMSANFVSAAQSTQDEYYISSAGDKYTPLYTTAPDSSLKDYSSNSLEGTPLFYTSTTFLALIAGYLILFKAKGIDHSQKMHRRKIKK